MWYTMDRGYIHSIKFLKNVNTCIVEHMVVHHHCYLADPLERWDGHNIADAHRRDLLHFKGH